MPYFYFDESIRDNGKFMIGALIISNYDLSPRIRERWKSMGLEPDIDEYKSSAKKSDASVSNIQREYIKSLMEQVKVGLVVLPHNDRNNLGNYCAELVIQLLESQLIPADNHKLILDDNIKMRNDYQKLLRELNVELCLKADSTKFAGIQVADHASHALGGMLLEQMGIIKKKVKAGENSGYHPTEMLDLGFELWADLRHSLIGKNTHIKGLSPHPDDPANPYFLVDGFGLFVAQSCSEDLREHAKECFGINYLGCIH